MSVYTMPAGTACTLIAALEKHGVRACIGGGWAVDALVGRQTREHSDLDVWVEAEDLHELFVAFAEHGIDRVHPWPGDRPWNFVLHDGRSLRVDLHLYETIGDGRLQYGSGLSPFVFHERELSGQGRIADRVVRCETPEFSLRNHAGYDLRDVDRHDVALLCSHFGLQRSEDHR